jgi:hypothetical protein
MEGSAGLKGSAELMEGRADRDVGVARVAQIGLLAAAAGALMVVFGLWPTVGLVLTVAGAVLTARFGFGRGWYTTVAVGAAFEVIGRILANSHQSLGGWLAVLASVVILVGVSLGYPTGLRERA